MGCVSKISSTGDEDLERRMPMPFDGIDVNFCRNPACATFGVIPDPYKRPNGLPPAPKGEIRGAMKGSKHEEFFDCPNCSSTARLKNNTAIVAEYRRHKVLQETDPTEPSCQTARLINIRSSIGSSARRLEAIHAGGAVCVDRHSPRVRPRADISAATRTVWSSRCSATVCHCQKSPRSPRCPIATSMPESTSSTIKSDPLRRNEKTSLRSTSPRWAHGLLPTAKR